MDKRNKTYRVSVLKDVDTTLYNNGDLFYTSRSIGVLHNGIIKTIGSGTVDLSGYTKREEVQNMIDEAIQNIEGDENE